MSNIKTMMASMYPAKSMKEALQSTPEITQPSPKCNSWDDNKVLVIVVLLGILYFILSLPKTYQATGNFFGWTSHNDLLSVFKIKMSLLHAVVFFVLSFCIIKIINTI